MKWLLLCNPNKWFGEGDDLNRFVNKILASLGEKGDYETELWKLNISPSMKMDKKIKDGDLGVIKVGVDTRSKKMRTYDNDDIKPLESGLYGIFKFVSTSYDIDKPQKWSDPITKEKYDQLNELLWRNGVNEIFGRIKVIDNFYSKDKIISKNESIKIMGENLFNSPGSRDMPEQIFIQIQEYDKWK